MITESTPTVVMHSESKPSQMVDPVSLLAYRPTRNQLHAEISLAELSLTIVDENTNNPAKDHIPAPNTRSRGTRKHFRSKKRAKSVRSSSQ